MNHTNNGQQYLLQETNYEAEVKKVYPDAVRCQYYSPDSGDWFIVHSGNVQLSAVRPGGLDAWEQAYKGIPEILKITTITVTGCGDCPMRAWATEILVYCLHPDHKAPTKNNYADLHEQCPLKTSPITIKLNQ